MILTKEEEEMTAGRRGAGIEKCMKILIRFGEAFGAEKFVRLSSAHVFNAFPIDLLVEMTEGAQDLGTFTTLHPFMSLGDPESWEEMCIPGERFLPGNEEHQKRLEIYNRLGFVQTYTCAPLLVGNFIKRDDYVSWFGSSLQLFVNSVIGARQNRDGAVVNMAAAITGRAPNWGLYLDENRHAEVLAQVAISDARPSDENGLRGHRLLPRRHRPGQKHGGQRSDERNMTTDEIKYLLTPLSTSGAVSLCHIVGLTPEAPDQKTALGGKAPRETIVVGREEIRRTKERFSKGKGEIVDLIILGCPHYTVQDFRKAASILENRKVNTNQRLWIGSARQIYDLAQTMGYAQIIEQAGGIISRSCMATIPDCPLPEDVGLVATDSFKIAHYVSTISKGRIDVVIGDMDECINAAVDGKWEGGP